MYIRLGIRDHENGAVFEVRFDEFLETLRRPGRIKLLKTHPRLLACGSARLPQTRAHLLYLVGERFEEPQASARLCLRKIAASDRLDRFGKPGERLEEDPSDEEIDDDAEKDYLEKQPKHGVAPDAPYCFVDVLCILGEHERADDAVVFVEGFREDIDALPVRAADEFAGGAVAVHDAGDERILRDALGKLRGERDRRSRTVEYAQTDQPFVVHDPAHDPLDGRGRMCGERRFDGFLETIRQCAGAVLQVRRERELFPLRLVEGETPDKKRNDCGNAAGNKEDLSHKSHSTAFRVHTSTEPRVSFQASEASCRREEAAPASRLLHLIYAIAYTKCISPRMKLILPNQR